MSSAGQLKVSKRQSIRGDHGRGKLHRKIARFGLSEAADNLGVATLTLRRKLQGKGIECDSNGRYTLRQVVEAVSLNGDSPAEKSLEAHSRLEANKARLTELEIEEKEGLLIRKEPVITFLKGLCKLVYSTVEGFNLGHGQTAAVCHAIEAAAADFTRSNGAPLMSLGEEAEARRLFPHLETPGELWARKVCCDYEARNEQRRGSGRPAAGAETATDRPN